MSRLNQDRYQWGGPAGERPATNRDWAGLLGVIAGGALVVYIALRMCGWP